MKEWISFDKTWCSTFCIDSSMAEFSRLDWQRKLYVSRSTVFLHFYHVCFKFYDFLSSKIFSLGLFSCITGLVASWKDHHFIYINVIWLASFIAASYLIKLIWELIFYFLADQPTQTWLIWVKYLSGLLIYTLQGTLLFSFLYELIPSYIRTNGSC